MITANRFFKFSFEGYKRLPKVGFVARMAALDLPLNLEIDEGPALTAYVNHGRWLVKCECGGCEYAWEEGLFMCQSCWNSGHKHKVRRVEFPKSRVKIEKLLEQRPLVNRNWAPGETLTQLERDNKEHKAELLEVR